MKKYWAQSNQTVRLATNLPKGTVPCFTAFFCASASNPSSPALTLGWLLGSSRNQAQKKIAHTTPMPPKNTNAQRHDISEMTQATSNGVKAPPHRALSHIIPWARPRSAAGSQIVNAFVRFGKHPASPMPKRNRQSTSEAAFHAQPVAAVNADHMSTTRISTLRGPMKSPSHPPGISNRAYAKPNAPKA